MNQELTDREIVFRFFDFLRKNVIFLIIAACVGGFMGFLKAYLSPLKYESKAVIFPVNTTDNDIKGGSSPFGMEMHTDQLIQVLKSDVILDSVRKYCDPDGSKHFTSEFLSGSLSFYRTPYLSIEITAKTSNPEDAFCIVSHLISHTNEGYNEIIRQATIPLMENAKMSYLTQKKEWEMLSDSIRIMTEKRNPQDKKVLMMTHLWEVKQKEVTDLESKYQALRMKAEKQFVPLFVLNKPTLPLIPSDKQYPKNILSGVILVLFAVVAFLTLRLQLLYWKQELNYQTKTN